jgi:hypothetical protein
MLAILLMTLACVIAAVLGQLREKARIDYEFHHGERLNMGSCLPFNHQG